MITLAEQDIKESNKKYTTLLCGILDCIIALLFFLPVFGDGGTAGVSSVAMTELTGISTWLKIVFIVITSLSVIIGFCTVVVSNFDKPIWNKHLMVTGMVLSIIGTMLFILTRQPYAGILFLCLLVIKGVLVQKSK